MMREFFFNKLRNLVLFFVLVSGITKALAQDTPGGVEGVIFWMDANQKYTGTSKDGETVSMWKPRVGTGVFTTDDLSSNSVARTSNPKYVKGSIDMAYRNAVSFGLKDYLGMSSKIGPGIRNGDAMTIFSVYIGERTKTNEARMYYIGFGSNNPHNSTSRKPTIGFSPKNGVTRLYVHTAIEGKLKGYKPFTTALHTVALRAESKSYSAVTNFYFEGVQDVSTEKVRAANLDFQSGAVIGGASYPENTGSSFMGQLGEIIMYDRVLSDSERQKVEAYLAAKYGITLRGVDYKMSNGVVMWPAGGVYGNDTNNQINFHNNVTGIMRDDAGLSNYVARSTAYGAVLSVSTKGSVYGVGTGIVKEAPLPENLTSLYWGTNTSDNRPTSGNIESNCGFNTKQVDKRWKFKKAGTNNPINVEIRAGGEYFPYSGSGYQVYMNLFKSEADAISGRNPYQILPGKYIGGELQEHLFDVNFIYSDTYVTFTAQALPGYCSSCTQGQPGGFKFNPSVWPVGSKSKAFVATNGMNFGINVQGNNLQNNYPAITSNDVLTLRVNNTRNTDANNPVIATIDMKDGASKVKFNLFSINKQGYGVDNVEIIGYCGNTPVSPSLQYEIKDTNFKNKAYEIAGNKVIGIRATAMKSREGMVNVEFSTPVSRIEVKYKVVYSNGRGIGTQEIGMGDFRFECARRPAPNPDGIDFALQAESRIKSCEELTYRFAVGNFNCGGRPADLLNVLPDGMEWVPNTLTATDDALKNAKVNVYGNSNTLKIEGIELKAVDYVYIEAKARLKDNAKVDIEYVNQASLTYVKENEGGSETVVSCDYSNSDICLSTRTYVEGTQKYLKPELTFVNKSAVCYRGKSLIELELSIDNKNSIDLTNVNAKFTFNDDFIFKSLKTSTGEVIESELYTGLLYGKNLVIKANSTAKYILRLEALELKELVEYATGKTYTSIKDIPDEDYLKVVQFDISAELSSDAADICMRVALENSFVSLLPIPFCGKDLSCYYPPVKGNVVKKNNDFVLLTTLDRSNGDVLDAKDINALLYLESKSKGFVPTRLTEAQINAISSPVAGMLLYDTTNKCLKIYTGTKWGCISQSCPDN